MYYIVQGDFMPHKNELLIGCHVSIAGGFYKAIEEGTIIGCTAVQIFTKSNRQWQSKVITDEEAQHFIQAQQSSLIKVVVAHASYLINLGSATPGVQEKSLAALIDEVRRCDKLKIPYLVLHPGTAEPAIKTQTLQQTGAYINEALKQTADCSTTILIETMAGQGKSIGSSFEELAIMLSCITEKNRIGVCFDTCHAFAAGYELRTQDGYEKTMAQFQDTIGLNYLKILHMNDSKKEIGSRVDRHEDIGQGALQLEAFAMIMNDARLQNIPKILETPVTTNAIDDFKRNLNTLTNLIKQR